MILVGFLVGLTLGLVGLFVVIVRGLELWRQAKQTGRAFASELARFEERAARAERLLTEADNANQNLQAATERLRRSRAQFEVLLGSIETARGRTRWLRAFLPVR